MSKLTDQELLNIIRDNNELTVNPIFKLAENNLPLFISTFGLEEGTLKIPVKLVYRLYKLWSSQKMTEDMFYKQMSLLMPNKEEIEGTMCYLLNSSTIKITEDIYKLIKDKKIKKENTYYYKKHFESFMKSCNIVKGSDWIKASDLRTTYLTWIKNKYKKNPLGLKNFEGFCRLYLDCRGNPLEVAVNKKVINAPTEKGSKER